MQPGREPQPHCCVRSCRSPRAGTGRRCRSAVMFAQAGIGLLRRMAPVGFPRVDDIAIDGVVLLFTLALSVVTGLMFGLLPAVRFGTLDFHVLKDAGRSASAAPGQTSYAGLLVVAQVALALVLLIVSGLMIRTFVAMRQVEPARTARRGANVSRQRATNPHPRSATAGAHVRRDRRAPDAGARCRRCRPRTVGPHGAAFQGAPIVVEDRPVTGTPPTRRVKPIGPGTSRRWATRWWPAARSRGPIFIRPRRSPSFPRISPANTGESHRRLSASVSEAPRRVV